jgi:hypothetical protein
VISELWVPKQFLGTDQSYHQAPPQEIIDLLKQAPYQAAFANQSLNVPEDYYFSHLTLTQMLNSGEKHLSRTRLTKLLRNTACSCSDA